jgi:lysophospholipase L1-like esterase
MDIARIYGFKKPYNFFRSGSVLLNVTGLILAASYAAILFHKNELDYWNSPRAVYFIYLAVLFVLGIVAGIFPRLSLCFFILGIVETALPIGNSAVLPEEYFLTNFEFEYHPLLQARPTPGFQNERIRHNSLGLRGQEIPLLSPEQMIISVFGGSTTYDQVVEQGKTWPEMLNHELGSSFIVLNYGVPGYSTVEHVIQTAFYESVQDRYPRCAVYYIGWNDIRNAHVAGLDPGYADFHLRSQHGNLRTRPSLRYSYYSPLLTIAVRYLSSKFETIDQPSYSEEKKVSNDSDLERIFLRNINTLYAINHQRGINTVFIGQLLNRSQLKDDKPYGWLPYVNDKDVWPLQLHFNQLLKVESEKLHTLYIDAGIDSFEENDFGDQGHFTAKGSKKFAERIAKSIFQFCH